MRFKFCDIREERVEWFGIDKIEYMFFFRFSGFGRKIVTGEF